MRKTVLGLLFLIVALSLLTGGACSQEEKKVLKTTVDEKGFEKSLTEVDLLYQTAKQYMAAGLYEKAVVELKKVVAADSTRIDAWNDMATSYYKLKKPELAAEAFQRALNVRPDDQTLLSNLGYAQVQAKQWNQAIATYEKMLASDSLSYDANVHLAFIYQLIGAKEKAVVFYEKAVIAKPDDIQSLGSLAKLYSALGKKEEAVASYEKAVAVAPDNVVLKSRLGTAYISAKRFDDAAKVFEQLVQASPENAAYRHNLGISYMQLKENKKAIAELEKAVELKPEDGAAYQQLATLYNEVGQYNRAIAMARKGLAYVKSKAGLYCLWGKSLEKLKRYDEAIEKFKKAVSDPQWGGYAKKQIERQKKLKIREERIKEMME